jgi:(E)-4-hydroxy-3-methylbut-2-enyl-diphosphate synthase
MFGGVGDPFRPVRRSTRVVWVGGVAIGGDHPIRIQSMTNTDTMDTKATVEQIVRLAEAGCEIVRVTAPSIREAENLREIRRELETRGVDVPLVADIHFTPNAAMIAAEVVEKVRINPGNYADKKKFEVREYDDSEYQAEIERVRDRFRPLVLRCRENGVAMRIGTNHGSLSDRIMNRFGDTPDGMVESALEFLDICEAEDFRDVVFSMKSSNTQVAIQAYRLLASRLEARTPGAPSYPFHVGVTEAGDSEDGRIKSAIGIGSLLEDGLGDTIRVSLTEDPVREVPVARAIVERSVRVLGASAAAKAPPEVATDPIPDPFGHARRPTRETDWAGLPVGGEAPVRVELDLDPRDDATAPLALDDPAATAAALATDLAGLRDVRCESLLVAAGRGDSIRRLGALRLELTSLGLEMPISLRVDPADASLLEEASRASVEGVARWVVSLGSDDPIEGLSELLQRAREAGIGVEWELEAAVDRLPELVGRVLRETPDGRGSAFSLSRNASVAAYRLLVSALADAGRPDAPIILRHWIDPASNRDFGAAGSLGDDALVDASVRLGSLLCDGIGDVVSLTSRAAAARAVDLGYRVLQGARLRTTRTEYISCPSCGRTLFDLEETTARIKGRTDHLRGVKIAVMGCIVNGPGEMADADFGYVGSGPGQVTLYVGKDVVARAVPEDEAPDRLVELIRDHGRWVEG